MMVHDAAPRLPPGMAAFVVNRRKWSRIITEIKAGYFAVEKKALSDYKLGLMVGLDHKSIEYLQKQESTQPRHYEGELLLAVHARYAGAGTINSGSASIVRGLDVSG